MYIPDKFLCGVRATFNYDTRKYDIRPNMNIPNLAFLNYKKPNGEIAYKKSYDNWVHPEHGGAVETWYDNVFLEGFEVLRTVGGSGNGQRQAYLELLDPRGFRIQVTNECFLHNVLMVTGVNRGHLIGRFKYALEGGAVVIVSENDPHINEWESYSEAGRKQYAAAEPVKMSLKDLVQGKMYSLKDGSVLTNGIYIGGISLATDSCVTPTKKYHIFMMLRASEHYVGAAKVLYKMTFKKVANAKEIICESDVEPIFTEQQTQNILNELLDMRKRYGMTNYSFTYTISRAFKNADDYPELKKALDYKVIGGSVF